MEHISQSESRKATLEEIFLLLQGLEEFPQWDLKSASRLSSSEGLHCQKAEACFCIFKLPTIHTKTALSSTRNAAIVAVLQLDIIYCSCKAYVEPSFPPLGKCSKYECMCDATKIYENTSAKLLCESESNMQPMQAYGQIVLDLAYVAHNSAATKAITINANIINVCFEC